MSNGKSIDLLTTGLQTPAGTPNSSQYWAPTLPVQAENMAAPNLANLYSQMQSSLMINAAVL